MSGNRTERLLTGRLSVFLIMLVLCALWGSAYPVVKMGYEILSIDKSHVPSIMLFAGIRYVLTGLILLIPGLIRDPKSFALGKSGCACVAVNTLFQVIGQYYFYYIGLARVPGSRAAILNSTTVFFAVFLASFVFRTEKYSLVKALSSLLAVLSVCILNYEKGTGFSFSLGAEGFILISSFLTAIATCLQRPLTSKTGVLPLCSYSFLAGGLAFTAYALLFGGQIRIDGASCIMLLVYVSLISALGFSVQALLLKHNDVSVISVFRTMLPVFGVILSAALLNESAILMRSNTIVSLILMIAAMLMTGLDRSKAH